MSETEDGRGRDSRRRDLLRAASRVGMAAGLVGGYGAFAMIAARFLYPARPRRMDWLFLAEERELRPGEAVRFRAPSGETINVARQGNAGVAEDFIALSSTCPHLGCQVHWEAQNDRFFCPCHNGVFDPSGKGTGGPPGEAGQSLGRYRLRIDGGLLFIEVPGEGLTAARRRMERIDEPDGAIHGPGHDPCLARVARAAGDGGRRS